jgi:CBS domain containing-hemolysin-like protein
MSYLDKFLIESSNRQRGSIESEEGDVEDNRAPSLASSKSNLSELSIVSITAVENVMHFVLMPFMSSVIN